ncbi:dehydrogenase [Polymorphobacter multimanifer]|uniref:Mono/diheme cytochrome c family protein/HEAT repeat protein/glucose/arabinose dehydrogenase n=1 Tax=Polymorphobacter multimanifer TaxID=1070431 RepID=A0A841L0X8_9SPHN|nr:c-type cytochrome [Polymorphobacter multimanifer]MBB6226479.1 mono/diheme cytochrome c family protein/HEAT repeat protein/glucose/arabinose dehydrogenase [Polymorphobacter multimanifer]GGI91294.1 dehydrogenase [Polymorphobacter multimanifer]
MRSGVKIVGGLLAGTLLLPWVMAEANIVPGPLTSQSNKPWPAFYADEPEAPPVLAPADALASFTMAPGYHLELVASEPLVKDPILMEFDPDGRLWVIELPGWAHNDKMENTLEPVNRLVVLEDTDADGVYDKRTVFMDKLVLPRAFKILDKGCALVGEPPNLWKACDTDGDLVADTKEVVADTFGRLGILEHGANGLYWGMDNTLVVSEHDWNLAYEAGKFLTVPGIRRGQWGVTQDDGGRIYRNVNTDPLFVDYVPPGYFVRNPNLVRTSGLYESLVDQETTNIWPAHPTFGLNRGYRREVFREDGTASYYGGVSSPMIYRGAQLPKDVQGQAFVADGATNIVHLLRLTDDNGKLTARDFYPKGEFLASTDVRFRPTALAPGWDGSFYIVDMYRGVSQDGPLQTDYLRDWIGKRQLARDTGRGRIYRVVADGMGRDARPQLSKATTSELIGHLSHANGWWRDMAQQLLVQRADKAGIPALKRLAASKGEDARPRLHALWTLNGLGAMEAELATRALTDPSADVRAAGLRLAEPWLKTGKGPVVAAVLGRLDDDNWFVRRQLAATLGELPEAMRMAPLLTLLKRYGDDKITVDAAASSLGGQEAQALAALLDDPAPPADALMMLAAATGKRRDPALAQQLIGHAGDTGRAAPVREAILSGLALGLTGSVGQAGNAVAGGRAGGAIPGVGPQRAGPQRFAMPAEPQGLTTLAGSNGPLAGKAREVLGLITWPGRPAPPALAARSEQEERLYLAGKALYAEQCAGCHQMQGQGAPNVAVALAGSKRVVDAGHIPVRILTNGYEGKIGLMPPLGAAMSDEELAALLTYTRQSWGNTGSPIPPAAVKEWRLAFAHREMPWTAEELAQPIR